MTYTVLIPAAGVGSRFGAPVPKQYAQIAGRPVLQHTLNVFAEHPQIARIAVIISPEDEWFDDTIRLPTNAAVYREGGATRAHTVANGLHALLQQQHLSPDTIVLVHDAARCCLPVAALNRLLDALPHCPDGAILAVPVAAQTAGRQSPHRAHRAARRFVAGANAAGLPCRQPALGVAVGGFAAGNGRGFGHGARRIRAAPD